MSTEALVDWIFKNWVGYNKYIFKFWKVWNCIKVPNIGIKSLITFLLIYYYIVYWHTNCRETNLVYLKHVPLVFCHLRREPWLAQGTVGNWIGWQHLLNLTTHFYVVLVYRYLQLQALFTHKQSLWCLIREEPNFNVRTRLLYPLSTDRIVIKVRDHTFEFSRIVEASEVTVRWFYKYRYYLINCEYR